MCQREAQKTVFFSISGSDAGAQPHMHGIENIKSHYAFHCLVGLEFLCLHGILQEIHEQLITNFPTFGWTWRKNMEKEFHEILISCVLEDFSWHHTRISRQFSIIVDRSWLQIQNLRRCMDGLDDLVD